MRNGERQKKKKKKMGQVIGKMRVGKTITSGTKNEQLKKFEYLGTDILYFRDP